MEAAGALGVAAPILESISNPSGGAGWSWVGCGCQKVSILDQIPTCLVLHIEGIKLQLLCGVRIELAKEVGMFVPSILKNYKICSIKILVLHPICFNASLSFLEKFRN